MDGRRMWTVAEPLHALTYFAEEAHQAFSEAGLRGFWRGYFAGRAAPLGAASASEVTATFFGFHPEFVARAIPSVWSITAPEDALAARLEGVDRAIRRIVGADLPPPESGAAAAAIREAAERCSVAGRPLFGANAGLDWPEQPHLALWHAVTLLREHRGDGHVSALTVAGVDPCAAHVLRIADDDLPLESIQPYRGWSETDWADARVRLRDRGWLDRDGRTTPEGRRARASIEADTDRLSADLVDRIADPDLVMGALQLLAEPIRQSGTIPYPNPVGVPAPT